jgi:purine-binding chemotaxis protein CheW
MSTGNAAEKALAGAGEAREASALPFAAAVEQDAAAQLELIPVHPEVERQYCIFRAGRERFCLSVLDVEEVVEWPHVTALPLAPAFLMGVFNLRGSIVPVIDIAFTEGRRADLPPRHVVVALMKDEDGEPMRLGIAADEVIGTHTTADALLKDEAPKDVPHCCGMLRHDDRLALAIDLEKLVAAYPVPVI